MCNHMKEFNSYNETFGYKHNELIYNIRHDFCFVNNRQDFKFWY